ncbi:MAG: CRISPR-associated RAMP protein Csx7 [Candidatus Bathyarchaeia archaeon]
MVFETLEKRMIFEGEIETITPLHVGSGKPEFEEAAPDLPVLRDVKGIPYVPGSSIKGRVRSEAERLANSLGFKVCNAPTIETMCGTRAKTEEDLCIVCKIFGTASMKGGISRASKVKFRDAYTTTPLEALLRRTGIALDRETGSVKPGALYTIEAVPAGTKFKLEIVAENLSEEELNLLKAALKSVEDSCLGGHSSRGFGKVKLHIDKIRVRTAKYYTGQEPEQLLEKF